MTDENLWNLTIEQLGAIASETADWSSKPINDHKRQAIYATLAAKATIEAAATNEKLVDATKRLVRATWTIAICTIVAAVGSIGLAVFT